jgi:hypothetical protein
VVSLGEIPVAGFAEAGDPAAVSDERELRAASDRMVAMLDRLVGLEQTKRTEPMESELFLDSARQAEELARLAFRWAGVQRELAEDAHARAASGRTPRTLEGVAARPLDRILAAWREAQIRLEVARPGSPEAAEAVDAIERLREEFRAVADQKHDAERRGERRTGVHTAERAGRPPG